MPHFITPTRLAGPALAVLLTASASSVWAAQDGSATAPAVAQAQDVAGGVDKESKALLEKSVEAMGGKEAIDAIKTLRMTFTMVGGGMNVTANTLWSADGAMVIRMTIPGMGEMETGTDGKVAWRNDPTTGTYRLMPLEDFEDMSDQAAIQLKMLRLDKTAEEEFTSVTSQGKATFNGRDHYKLHAVDEDGDKMSLYLDAETMLPSGSQEEDPDSGSSTTTITDWKEIDGVKFFSKLTFSSADEDGEMNFTKIVVNDVDPSELKAPDSVASQAATQPSGGADGAGSGSEKDLDDFSPEQRRQIESMLQGTAHLKDADQLRSMISSMESAISFLPADQADQREVFEYLVPKLKERLAELEG